MTSGAAALCLGPGGSDGFTVRQLTRRRPAAVEIEVAVTAASVNPIDVRRSEGYGRKLLSLIGAGTFPLVLGNDFAGTVTAVGSRVATFKIGDRVYGVKPASTEGTHASHVLVKAVHVLAVPEGLDLHPLAAIPYSFTTMWLAVRGAGLSRENAAGKNVLVHGAAGALGTLATQMLSSWGARVTAIARKSNSKACLEAGATEVVERTDELFVSLGRTFDATLNFATWEDDLALLGCLRVGALGHATTVHPMLGNFDRLGWLRGLLKTISQKKHHRRALPKGASNYAWVLFKPHKAALDDLRQFVEHNHVSLPIGLCKPLAAAGEAFDHVRKRQPGRALLLP
ncbi:alcohol dehydrogenase catalytic domain-containing protein [Mesorhizobium ventifaucium]|uniref:NADPH:quinone reductase n=1 Tax=Mesorhizobium ventifaucium TaxID=666020 RepID=A0ABN8K999_9HYPH|nr:alcohol dehydrogenase catalytic domain-containing protein [Mesorhizobium ventifaucium]CAH2406828.1 Putative NADPH:quinone reductase [Mesorhizobium ventifaucium]